MAHRPPTRPGLQLHSFTHLGVPAVQEGAGAGARFPEQLGSQGQGEQRSEAAAGETHTQHLLPEPQQVQEGWEAGSRGPTRSRAPGNHMEPANFSPLAAGGVRQAGGQEEQGGVQGGREPS